MKKVLALLLALAMLLCMAACGPADQNASQEPSDSAPATEAPSNSGEDNTPDTPADDSANLICIVSESSQGAPFSQQTWKGFEKVNETYGTQIKFVEALQAAEYETQLRSMAEVGAKVIFSMFDAVNLVAAEIAPEYPDVRFVLIDCNETFDIPNVTSIVVDSWEPSFVAGVVAALTTETGHVGWVGSLDISVITRFYQGYCAGIDYANQTFDLDVTVEKTYIGSSEDTVKAAEATNILISNKADVIYQAANEAGLGVIQACADAGVKCIGVDSWQGGIDPCVFWSALVAIEDGVFETYTAYLDGTLNSGSINYGIANGFPIYAEVDYNALPDNVKTAVDEVMTNVANGALDVFAYGEALAK